jgi:hypothetical protein
MLRLVCLGAFVGLLLGVCTAQPRPSGQHFMSGEVIVRFSAKSKGSDLSARALAEGNPSDAALSSYIQSVSSDVGVTLEVKRFGSGGNVILGIRHAELVANLLKRFRRIASVENAHSFVEQSASASSVEVVFKENSPECEVLAQAAKKGTEPSAQVDAITKKLEQDSMVALTARVVSPSHLLVTPDWQRLTIDLAKRLAKRADVEYAQPNFIRRATSGNSDFQLPK